MILHFLGVAFWQHRCCFLATPNVS